VEINKLKDKYNVVIDEGYFKSAEQAEAVEAAQTQPSRGIATADASVEYDKAAKRLA
jgi:hypothetical protein